MADGTSLTCPLGDGWSLEAAGSRRERGELMADVLLQNGTPIPAYADAVALASDAARQAFVAKATGPGRPSAEAIAGGLLALMTEALTEVQKPTTPVAAVTERLTDYGNAEKLVTQHGKDVRYCLDHRAWYVWDETRWARDDDAAEVMRRAKQTVRSMYVSAGGDDGQPINALLSAHAIRSEANARLLAMIDLAKSEKPVEVRANKLDADPWLLNCNNGTLDLRTGTLHDHTPTDNITKLVPVEYTPEAVCPTFDAFLTRILPDAEVRDFIQRFAGYSLTGDTSEQVMAIPWGSGQNGKSTLLSILSTAMGDYALAIDSDTIMVKRSEGIRTDLARLAGARLITAIESEDGKRLAEGLIKGMTGGDPITARELYSREFSYVPSFKILFSTNHRPTIRGTDLAIWRRIRLIPFTVTITEKEKDKRLLDTLRSELPGILAWAVRGCLAWQQSGLGTPKAVTEATAAYRAEQDALGGFIEDCCVATPKATATANALFLAYQGWCEANGEQSMKQRALGIALRERGYQQDRGTGGVRFWIGIGLRYDGDEPPDSDATDPAPATSVTPNIPAPEGGKTAVPVTQVTQVTQFPGKSPMSQISATYPEIASLSVTCVTNASSDAADSPAGRGILATVPSDTTGPQCVTTGHEGVSSPATLPCAVCNAPAAPYTTADGRRVCLDCITRPLPPRS